MIAGLYGCHRIFSGLLARDFSTLDVILVLVERYSQACFSSHAAAMRDS